MNFANPKQYTGHTSRRIRATLLADSGADILVLKRHGEWKSISVAENYVGDSLNNEIFVAKQILGSKPQTVSVIEEASVPITFSEQLQLSNLSNLPNLLDKPSTSSAPASTIEKPAVTTTLSEVLQLQLF